MLLTDALNRNPDLDEDDDELTSVLASNLCRCTGYVGIRAAVEQAAAEMRRDRLGG
jgi:carbon-monoxide dehydrogenase small subunit